MFCKYYFYRIIFYLSYCKSMIYIFIFILELSIKIGRVIVILNISLIFEPKKIANDPIVCELEFCKW